MDAVEQAIQDHIQEQCKESLRRLYRAILENKLLVPVREKPTVDEAGNTHLPLIFMHFGDGVVATAVFTSKERLLEWDVKAKAFVRYPGSTIFKMVARIPEIQVILVNYSQKSQSPKGGFSRREFELLAQGIVPGED
jgi:hypothetical protein